MDLNKIIQEQLINTAKSQGIDVLYDAIDSWGKRFDLESETKEEVMDFMNNHYWENEDMEERRDDLDFTIVAYYFKDDGEKKDIVEISSYVEYEKPIDMFKEHGTIGR